jgi:hypothetical protein
MDTDPTIKGSVLRKDMVRFFSFISNLQDGCWIWNGCINPNGYGEFHYNGTNISAHRMSYLIYYGEFPNFALVLHKCDIKRCVNPKHLYLGSYTQNLLDSYDKHPETLGRRWYKNREGVQI